jgi:hypothetical protein
MSSQDNLNSANELGRTIAQLMAQPMPRSSSITQAIDGLIMTLTAKAQQLVNPPAIKACSPNDIVVAAGDTVHIHGNGDVEINTSGPVRFTGEVGLVHAPDCATKEATLPAGLTLESYFKDNQARGVIDFSLRAFHLPDGEVGFYLHPGSVDGHTPQFTVKGNVLTTHTPA